MARPIFKAAVLWLVAIPAVEFVDLNDRLPQLYPGLLTSAIFAALVALVVLIAY
jgi:hypothetical protein